MSKKDLRNIIMDKRQMVEVDNKKLWDKKIKEQLLNSEEYKNAKTIFIYVNMSDEVNTIEIIKFMLKDGKQVAVPKVITGLKSMEALEIKNFSDLSESGVFGILEPTMEAKNISNKIDISIVPGLAFDCKKRRLGYGGGFYDKFFEKYPNSTKIALCYEYQILDEIEVETFDKEMDIIITEEKIIR